MRIVSLRQTTTTTENGVNETLNAVIEVSGGTRETIIVSKDHPAYGKINAAVTAFSAGSLSQEDLASAILTEYDLLGKVEEKINRVTDFLDGRMSIQGTRVTIDGDPIDNVLESHIIGMLSESGTPKDDQNWKAFGKFVENLYSNVQEDVREQLFRWIVAQQNNTNSFTLTDDGCFLGYKGCAGSVDNPVSINQGSATVDNVPHRGQIPNPVGAIVEMPRSAVENNPRNGCAPGLHVGTYEYAHAWAKGVLLLVKVNPRDVVSVPYETVSHKIRTCRYEVLDVTPGPFNELTFGSSDYDGEEDNYEVDYDEYDNEDDWSTTSDETLDSLNPDDLVEFDYVTKDGRRDTYWVRVRSVSRFELHGDKDDNPDTPRSFNRERIESLVVLNSEEDSSTEYSNEDGPTEETHYDDAPDDNCFNAETFLHNVEDAVYDITGAKVNLSKFVPVIDEPLSDLEQFIARFGFGDKAHD